MRAFYAQEQWTFRRFTLSGALRYDHSTSSYGETCIGPDPWVPLQSNGQRSYCVPESDGVSYHDITPRWGAVWDVFGTGRTSVKWNMGRYLTAAGISGIYSGANPARRTVNHLTAHLDRHGWRSRRRLRPDATYAARVSAGRSSAAAPIPRMTPRASAAIRCLWMRVASRSACRTRSAAAPSRAFPRPCRPTARRTATRS